MRVALDLGSGSRRRPVFLSDGFVADQNLTNLITFGGTGNQYAHAIAQCSVGWCVVGVGESSQGGPSNAFLATFSSGLTPIKTVYLPTMAATVADVAEYGGSLFVSGAFSGGGGLSAITKLDVNGNAAWLNKYQLPGQQGFFNAIAVVGGNKGFVAFGQTGTSAMKTAGGLWSGSRPPGR